MIHRVEVPSVRWIFNKLAEFLQRGSRLGFGFWRQGLVCLLIFGPFDNVGRLLLLLLLLLLLSHLVLNLLLHSDPSLLKGRDGGSQLSILHPELVNQLPRLLPSSIGFLHRCQRRLKELRS